jgi:exonuclease III
MDSEDIDFSPADAQKVHSSKNIEKFYSDARNVFLAKLFFNYVILHQNIRSIHTNFDSLVCSLGSNLPRIDILILTEINCKAEDFQKYKIPGYAQIAHHRQAGRGGGIAIYFKGAFNIKVLDSQFGSAETLKLKINDELELLAIYRPPSSSKMAFVEELNHHMNTNVNCGRDFIILGDLNLNLLDAKDRIIEHYENSLSEGGFDRCIFSPTREEFCGGHFSSTLIDHVFHKFHKFHNMSTVLTSKVSDHYATQREIFPWRNAYSTYSQCLRPLILR